MRQAASAIKTKHLRLDQSKIERARKVLGATTDTDTIERALDLVLVEHARNRSARAAHARFLRDSFEADVEIRDVFGGLVEPDL